MSIMCSKVVVVGLSTVGADKSLTLLPALRTHILLLDCLVQVPYEGFCLNTVSYFVVFDCSVLEACSFLNGNVKWGGKKEESR